MPMRTAASATPGISTVDTTASAAAASSTAGKIMAGRTADPPTPAPAPAAAIATSQTAVSAGHATWMPGETPDDILRRADGAMYAAKRGGRDQVQASA